MTAKQIRDVIVDMLGEVGLRDAGSRPWKIEAQFDGDNVTGPTIAIEVDGAAFIVEVKAVKAA